MKMDILSTNFIRRRIQQNAERAFAQFVRCYARKKTEIILKKNSCPVHPSSGPSGHLLPEGEGQPEGTGEGSAGGNPKA